MKNCKFQPAIIRGLSLLRHALHASGVHVLTTTILSVCPSSCLSRLLAVAKSEQIELVSGTESTVYTLSLLYTLHLREFEPIPKMRVLRRYLSRNLYPHDRQPFLSPPHTQYGRDNSCTVCFFCLYGYGFLSRCFTDRREILHGGSA